MDEPSDQLSQPALVHAVTPHEQANHRVRQQLLERWLPPGEIWNYAGQSLALARAAVTDVRNGAAIHQRPRDAVERGAGHVQQAGAPGPHGVGFRQVAIIEKLRKVSRISALR
jgi:hypothetical protein